MSDNQQQTLNLSKPRDVHAALLRLEMAQRLKVRYCREWMDTDPANVAQQQILHLKARLVDTVLGELRIIADESDDD